MQQTHPKAASNGLISRTSSGGVHVYVPFCSCGRVEGVVVVCWVRKAVARFCWPAAVAVSWVRGKPGVVEAGRMHPEAG
jgi:hypothetical protein